MNRKMKKNLSWLLTLAMCGSVVPYGTLTTQAAEIEQTTQVENNITTDGAYVTTGGAYITTSGAYQVPDSDVIWNPIVFGDSASIDMDTNTGMPYNYIDSQGDTILIESSGNKGKISSTSDGIAFYNTELPADSNFEIKVKANVQKFTTGNSQVSFGLMLRNKMDENGSTDKTKPGSTSAMLGVGGLHQVMEVYGRPVDGGSNAQIEAFKTPMKPGEYEFSIKKSGDLYQFACNGETFVGKYNNVFSQEIYAGVYTARSAKVEYTDLVVEKVEDINDLSIESLPKQDYLLNEAMDLTGLVVTADGQVVPTEELIIYGFDTSVVTQNSSISVVVGYAGKTVSFPITVSPLTCTDLKVYPTPAKTTYYLDDVFDTTGMVVNAKFNSGEERVLGKDEYTISAPDMTTPGEKTVTVTYNGTSEAGIQAEFTITVVDEQLLRLEVVKNPVKTLYYIGEELDTKGLVIKAIYDNSEVQLTADEYTIDDSQFETQTPGTKVITVNHKTATIEIHLTVKEKDIQGIKVTTLPQTTYTVGEVFDATGIIVSKVYDNGDEVAIDVSEYVIDASAFDGSKAGTYGITINPVDQTLKPITFDVSVREEVAYEWNSISFGQSISLEKNFVEAENPGTLDGTIKLTALEGGGKITNSFQDGITFYYTEIDNTKDNFELSADIKVIDFAKPTPDNQEGFGIMARDAIGTHGDASVFYSNIAAVGGYRGKSYMVMRSGVTASDASGAGNGYQQEIVLDNARPSVANTYPAQDYRLTLKKTNSGYTAQINDGEEVLCFEPDALGAQDDKVYVGFYAARLATIEVSNVEFKVTDAATDAPKVEAPAKPVAPRFDFSSLTYSSTKDYALKMYANVDGTITIKQGEEIIVRDQEVKGGDMFTEVVELTQDATTPFTVTFVPDPAQNLTTYDKIVKTLSVTMKTYGAEGEVIIVSPKGTSSGEGTQESPLDIDTAIKFVKPGQTIYLLEGTYTLTKAVGVAPGNNGTADAMKTLAAYPGAKVTIDANKKVSGFNLDGDYWHIFGIDFTGATSTGFRVGGNHNIVELCNTYGNGDTGLQISRYGNGGYETWPAYNLILNCTSYDNIDASENNADGFAAKLTCGPGNVFKGCISHNNIDDAWDLFAKGSTGPIGAVILEDCIAYENGTLTNGYVGKGDKNGFKLGGEGIAVPHVIKNSIAFNNGATGFSSNSNPAVISENCVSYDNEAANFDWRVYTNVEPQFKATGNVSYRSTKGPKDVYPTNLVSKDNFFYDGEKSVNSEGIVLTDDNFVSLITPTKGYERDEKGDIIFGDFLKFISPYESDGNNGSGGSSDDEDNSTSQGATSTSKPSVDDMIIDMIKNDKTPTINMGSNESMTLKQDTVEQLIANNKELVVVSQNVSLVLTTDFLKTNCLNTANQDKLIEFKVSTLQTEVVNQIQTQVAKTEGTKTVGGEQFMLDLGMSLPQEKMEEPLQLVFDLSNVKVNNPSQLTLVRYEKQADNTYKLVKLGGAYNVTTKQFTALVDQAGSYGLIEVEDLLKVILAVGQTQVIINDQVQDNDIAPLVVNNRTMVPLRFVAEQLGAEVKWEHLTKEVIIKLADETLTLKLDEVMDDFDTPCMMSQDRVLVPLRYVSEKMGANVLWIPSSKGIQIVK